MASRTPLCPGACRIPLLPVPIPKAKRGLFGERSAVTYEHPSARLKEGHTRPWTVQQLKFPFSAQHVSALLLVQVLEQQTSKVPACLFSDSRIWPKQRKCRTHTRARFNH